MSNKQKVILGIVLFALGILGVLSLLSMEIPLPQEALEELEAMFKPGQIKLVLLVNPTFMLIGAIVAGVLLHEKVRLDVPLVKRMMRTEGNYELVSVASYGIIGGIVAGLLISLVGAIFTNWLPAEFLELSEKLKPTMAMRFLYGGITEEILMRFGLMTALVWVGTKVFKKLDVKAYVFGLVIAAVIFALGHFPIAYQVVQEPSNALLSYILLGNTLGGLVFGWLYWKKGLEAAIIAHIIAHVVMVLSEQLLV